MKRFDGCEARPFRIGKPARPLKPYYLPQMSWRYFGDRIERITPAANVRLDQRIERWNKRHGLL